MQFCDCDFRRFFCGVEAMDPCSPTTQNVSRLLGMQEAKKHCPGRASHRHGFWRIEVGNVSKVKKTFSKVAVIGPGPYPLIRILFAIACLMGILNCIYSDVVHAGYWFRYSCLTREIFTDFIEFKRKFILSFLIHWTRSTFSSFVTLSVLFLDPNPVVLLSYTRIATIWQNCADSDATAQTACPELWGQSKFLTKHWWASAFRCPRPDTAWVTNMKTWSIRTKLLPWPMIVAICWWSSQQGINKETVPFHIKTPYLKEHPSKEAGHKICHRNPRHGDNACTCIRFRIYWGQVILIRKTGSWPEWQGTPRGWHFTLSAEWKEWK